MLIRKIKKEEIAETMKLSSICFEYPFSVGEYSEEAYIEHLLETSKDKGVLYWKERFGAFSEEGELMSCLSLIPFDFFYENTAVKGIGIGNVCTYPHHRKKGAVRKIYEKILPYMYENGNTFSYLYPFSESFYGQFGYHRLSNSVCCRFDLNSIPAAKITGTFHLFGNGASEEDFFTAYENFAKPLNLMVQRDSYDWSVLYDAKGPFNNNYAYLYKDEQGTPRGYLIFKKAVLDSVPLLNCRELVFDSFETLCALFSFAKSYGADFKQIRFHAPAACHLEHFCNDFATSNSTMSIANNGMVRVVSVEKVLRLSSYRGDGSLAIAVSDPHIEQNNGTFHIKYQNGKLTDLVFESSFSNADISMPINLFSAAITGSYSCDDFSFLDGITIHTDAKRLQSVFYKKPSFINNYF